MKLKVKKNSHRLISAFLVLILVIASSSFFRIHTSQKPYIYITPNFILNRKVTQETFAPDYLNTNFRIDFAKTDWAHVYLNDKKIISVYKQEDLYQSYFYSYSNEPAPTGHAYWDIDGNIQKYNYVPDTAKVNLDKVALLDAWVTLGGTEIFHSNGQREHKDSLIGFTITPHGYGTNSKFKFMGFDKKIPWEVKVVTQQGEEALTNSIVVANHKISIIVP